MRTIFRHIPLAVLAIGIFAAPSAAPAATTERIASGLNRPIFLTSPADDARLFFIEQRGVIYIWENGAVLPVPFLDIDALIPNISGNDERGLLGLAFDPGYAQNGRFYVNYINLSSQTVIARYLVSSDPYVADPGSAEILLTITQPFGNHNGGTVKFGPDGYLYIGMGDGGSAGDPGNRAQTPSTLLGKMLRIDVSGPSGYTVPDDNPFVGEAGWLPEIWAWGLRNPYRFSFDREMGDLWIADVGQSAWEEIDFQPASSPGGENYGWRLMEGSHCYNPPENCDDGDPVLTYPIHEYPHSQGCSVTGGYVYRGARIPELQGTYFFADFCSNRIWSLRYDGENVYDFVERTTELAPGGGLQINSIASFGEDASGEMYIVDRGSGSNGEIFRILPEPASVPGDSPAGRGIELRLGGSNPAAGSVAFTLDVARASSVEVRVLDPAGRVVRTLETGERSSGRHHLSWDGRDDAGREAPSGHYFLRAIQAGERSVLRVTLLR